MFGPVRAEVLEVAGSAVLPCGCPRVVLSHDAASVQFGIEKAVCPEHAHNDVAIVGKRVLITSIKPDGAAPTANAADV